MNVGKTSFLDGLYSEAGVQAAANASAQTQLQSFITNSLATVNQALDNRDFLNALSGSGTASLLVQADDGHTYYPMEKCLRITLPNVPIGGLKALRERLITELAPLSVEQESWKLEDRVFRFVLSDCRQKCTMDLHGTATYSQPTHLHQERQSPSQDSLRLAEMRHINNEFADISQAKRDFDEDMNSYIRGYIGRVLSQGRHVLLRLNINEGKLPSDRRQLNDGIEVVHCRVKQPLCLAQIDLFVRFLKEKMILQPECFFEGQEYSGDWKRGPSWTLLPFIRDVYKSEQKGTVVEILIPRDPNSREQIVKYKTQPVGPKITFG